MKILIDMNLPPRWARQKDHIILTHDLDFGVLLSLTQEAGPSVIQVRTQDITPEAIGPLILAALEKHGEALNRGALISIHGQSSRIRILPIYKANTGE